MLSIFPLVLLVLKAKQWSLIYIWVIWHVKALRVNKVVVIFISYLLMYVVWILETTDLPVTLDRQREFHRTMLEILMNKFYFLPNQVDKNKQQIKSILLTSIKMLVNTDLIFNQGHIVVHLNLAFFPMLIELLTWINPFWMCIFFFEFCIKRGKYI